MELLSVTIQEMKRGMALKIAEWEKKDFELRIWIKNNNVDHVTDITLEWFKALVKDRPYLLADLTAENLYKSHKFAEK